VSRGILPPEAACAWAAVATECPAGADIDAHRIGDVPLVHTTLPGGAARCRPGARNHDVGGRCFLPVEGLVGFERTTEAYRLAELVGRLVDLSAPAAAPATKPAASTPRAGRRAA